MLHQTVPMYVPETNDLVCLALLKITESRMCKVCKAAYVPCPCVCSAATCAAVSVCTPGMA